MTRVLLYTGKGGVGKTTSAAGTATLAALRGRRTLALSTDSAHSLSDAFDAVVGCEPTQLDDLLFVQQLDGQRRFERSWAAVQDYLRSMPRAAGADPIEAQELTVLPGAAEVLALLELRAHVRSGRWDVIVVDCAPTAETLRLLALPEALNWYLDRILLAGPAVPPGVVEALRRLQRDLADVRTLLAGPDASVRLVLTPEAVVVAEARRCLTTLSLYGYRVDGVVANRVFPAAGADNWRRQWVAAQRAILDDVADSFRPLPIWESPYRVCEPVGMEELAAFAVEMYGSHDPLARATDETSWWVDPHIDTDGRTYTLIMPLPLASADELDLTRHGDDLVVTVGSYRRVLPLPAVLAKVPVGSARLEDGRLQVRFVPRESGPAPWASVRLEPVVQQYSQEMAQQYNEQFRDRHSQEMAQEYGHQVAHPGGHEPIVTEGNR